MSRHNDIETALSFLGHAETQLKGGARYVHGDVELIEKLGRYGVLP